MSSMDEEWNKEYIKSIKYLFELNNKNKHKMIETTLSLHLKRIFEIGFNGFVDLRNPNPAGKDFLVIDFDGNFYPSDEARMLSRIGLINLKIGSLMIGYLKFMINLTKNS